MKEQGSPPSNNGSDMISLKKPTFPKEHRSAARRLCPGPAPGRQLGKKKNDQKPRA